MKKKGFTLVELLAVIAILAILVIMALPAVLKMFTQARVDTFNNELNTIVRTARQQYLLSGGQATTYSKDSNPLSLTGNSELNYCITINGQGQIIELKATNGSYKYESNGIVSETSSSDIENAESGYTLHCTGSSLTYVNRQNEGSITVGDEVAIDTEHFYVISSDSTNTVLLAKYNLLVGNVFETSDGSTWSFTKTLTSSDSGYGLQNEIAKGYYEGGNDYTATVAFSGKGYWDNADCVWSGPGSSSTCPGIAGLKSEYANASHAAGSTSYNSSVFPYVYNSTMSSTAPSYGAYSYSNGGNTWQAAQDNGYTIAYYVEGYVNTLKSLGAPSSITGRLLTYEEARSLVSSNSSIVYNYSLYWLGSVYGDIDVWYVNSSTPSEGWEGYDRFNDGSLYAIEPRSVRPVIEIPTSEMPN